MGDREQVDVVDSSRIEEMLSRLEGKTIVSSHVDVEGLGFHVTLDDGNVLIICWDDAGRSFVVGLCREAGRETLQ